eukprot:361775-Chlamydomonas_euryale.AAC.18
MLTWRPARFAVAASVRPPRVPICSWLPRPLPSAEGRARHGVRLGAPGQRDHRRGGRRGWHVWRGRVAAV